MTARRSGLDRDLVRCRIAASVPGSTAGPSRRSSPGPRAPRARRGCDWTRGWARLSCRSTTAIRERSPPSAGPGRRRLSSSSSSLASLASAAISGDLLPVARNTRAPSSRVSRAEVVGQRLAPPGIGAAVHAAEQVNDLATGQRRPQRDVAGHVREPAVQGGRVPPGVAAEQGDVAAVLAEQAEAGCGSWWSCPRRSGRGRRAPRRRRPSGPNHLALWFGRTTCASRAPR